MKKVLTLMLAFVLGLSLTACGPKAEDVENLADAVQKLSLDVNYLEVTSDIDLPSTGLHESTITWESSNTDVIANDGTVTRPAVDAGDVTVTLTATLTIGKATETKEFVLKVLESVPSTLITIAELNSDAYSDGDAVEIQGVVIGMIQGKGYHIADETGFSYVYTGGDTEFAVGDEVRVMGYRKTYYNIIEVVDVESEKLISSGNDLPAYTATTIADIYSNDNTDSSIYNEMISFDGFVTLQGAYDNVYLSWYTAELELQQVEVYYKSGSQAKIDEVAALEGKFVNLESIFMDYYSSAPVHYRVSVNAHDTVAEARALTDQEKANLSVAFVDLDILSTTGVDYDLTLNTTSDYTGATMVWTSSNEAVISTAGVVTQTAGQNESVTLTVTATVGTATATRTFTIEVLDADLSVPVSVSDALAMTDGEEALVQAVVAGFNYKGYPLLQDEDGISILVWGKEYNGEIGDEVVVRGTLSTHNDLRQFADVTYVRVESTDNDIVYTTMTAAEITDFANFTAVQQGIYTMELTIENIADGNYTRFTGNGTNVLSLYTNGHIIRDLYENGDTVTLTFFVSGKGSDYIGMELVAMPLTNEQKLAAVEAEIALDGDVTADVTLPTTLEDYDATITWTSSDETVVALNGTVVRPAIGEADASITLTASIVIGDDAAVVRTYTITVLATPAPVSGPELFISEYIEGSGNNKAIEIYNPTGDTIDLTSYALVLNYGSGTVNYPLTGTLASGEVRVYCNSAMDTGTALETECDEPSAYPNSPLTFNGDDTLQLLKDGVVIDQFGIDANAGGDDYAKNQVWVRNATVVNGVDVFDATQWTVVNTDGVVDYLTIGSHTCDEPTS